MAKLPDPTTTLSPEATKVYEKIARKRRSPSGSPTRLARSFDTPLPEGQRAPF